MIKLFARKRQYPSKIIRTYLPEVLIELEEFLKLAEGSWCDKEWQTFVIRASSIQKQSLVIGICVILG